MVVPSDIPSAGCRSDGGGLILGNQMQDGEICISDDVESAHEAVTGCQPSCTLIALQDSMLRTNLLAKFGLNLR